MSFHPKMAYGATFHKSARTLDGRRARRSSIRRRTAPASTRSSLRYPPDRRRSAVLPALYLVQHQQGYITANAMRYVADCSASRAADVEDVVSYYTMFFTKPVGRFVLSVCRTLSCALNGAERVTEELRGEARHQAGRNRSERHVHADRSRVPRRLRPRAGDHDQRCVAGIPEAGGRRRLLDDLRTRGEAALTGCHHVVERRRL